MTARAHPFYPIDSIGQLLSITVRPILLLEGIHASPKRKWHTQRGIESDEPHLIPSLHHSLRVDHGTKGLLQNAATFISPP